MLEGERRTWVEELALVLEALQLPRMSGRVLGQLLSSGEPHQSLDALARQLGASKASMSTTARQLCQAGYVERVPVPGQRGHHYAIRQGAWQQFTRRHVELLRQLREVAERAIDGRDGDQARLVELRDGCAALEARLGELLDGHGGVGRVGGAEPRGAQWPSAEASFTE